MTTSEELYVWTWLPGQTEPVLAGRVDRAGPLVTFIYALRCRTSFPQRNRLHAEF